MRAAVVATDAATVLAQGHMGSGAWHRVVAVVPVLRWCTVGVALQDVGEDGGVGVGADSCSCGGEVVLLGTEMATCRCEDRCRVRDVAHKVRCMLVRGVHCVRELEALAAQGHRSGEDAEGGAEEGAEQDVEEDVDVGAARNRGRDWASVQRVSSDAEQHKARAGCRV